MVEKDASKVSDADLDAWINALYFKKSKTRYEEKKLEKFMRMRRQRQSQSHHEKQKETEINFHNKQKNVAALNHNKVKKKALRKSDQFMFTTSKKLGKSILIKSILDNSELHGLKVSLSSQEMGLIKAEEKLSYNNKFGGSDTSCDKELFVGNSKQQVSFDMYGENNSILSNKEQYELKECDTNLSNPEIYDLNVRDAGDICDKQFLTNETNTVKSKKKVSFKHMFDTSYVIDNTEHFLLKECYIKIFKLETSWLSLLNKGDFCDKQFLTDKSSTIKPNHKVYFKKTVDTRDLISNKDQYNKKIPCLIELDKDDICDEEQFLTNESNTMETKKQVSFINMFHTSDNDDIKEQLHATLNNKKNIVAFEANSEVDDRQKYQQQISFKNMFDTKKLLDGKEHYLPKEGIIKESKQELLCTNVLDNDDNNKKNIVAFEGNSEVDDRQKQPQQISFKNMFDTEDLFDNEENYQQKESNTRESKQEISCSKVINKDDICDEEQFLTNEKNTLKYNKNVSFINLFDTSDKSDNKEQLIEAGNNKKNMKEELVQTNLLNTTTEFDLIKNSPQQTTFDTVDLFVDKDQYPDGTNKDNSEKELSYSNEKCPQQVSFINMFDTSDNSVTNGKNKDKPINHKKSLKGHIEYKHTKTRIEKEIKFIFCDKCDYKTKYSYHLTEHIKFKHEDLQLNCDKCDYKCRSRRSMLRHKKFEHEGIQYSCEQCSYKCKEKRDLQVHIESIHQGVRYYCEKCTHSSKSNKSLREHIKYMHEGIGHKCDECTFKTTRKFILKEHNKLKHEGTQYTCDQCDFTTKHKSYLNEHKTHKHDITVKTYSCDQCDFKTNNSGIRHRHIDITHKGIMYSCEQCDYKAKQKVSLVVHRYKHSGTFRYSCNLCSFKVNEKGKLNKHMKKKH